MSGTQTKPETKPETQYAIGNMKVVALSIAGPFAYWLASGHTIRQWGAKSIELRSWTRNNFQNVIVLLHVSSNTDFDYAFSHMDFAPEKAPKFSIVGAAVLSEIRQYNDAESFERDRRSHCWLGDETYAQVVQQYEGDHPYGHVMTKPILFDKPILDVPGSFNYWTPKPGGPKFDRQERAFKKAIKLLEKQRQLVS